MPLSDKDREFITNIKYDDISYTFIESNFCSHLDPKTNKIVKPKISFQEEFDLKPGEYNGLIKTKTRTNVGQYILNTALYGNCPNIQKLIGYKNLEYTKKVIAQIEDEMMRGMIAGKINQDEFAKYLNNIQWFGNAFNAHTSASFTPSTIKMLPKVKKMKSELFKKHAKEIENKDAVTATKISNALLDEAKKELKDNVGMQVYNSGAKPKFDNAYRAMFTMRGAVYNPVDDDFDISEKAFVEGMDSKDIPTYANSVINGAYPKAIGTAVVGYETKKMFACYQAMKAGPKGSDCHSKKYREVLVTAKNKDNIINRYYLHNGKTELLTEELLNKLVGKKILIRSPLYCTAEGGYICNKCIGEVPYILGIENIGLTTSSFSGALLNLHMKSFHDTSIKLVNVDINNCIIE